MNLYFPTLKEKQKVEEFAKKMGLSPSSFIRLAVRKYIEKQRHEQKVEKHG